MRPMTVSQKIGLMILRGSSSGRHIRNDAEHDEDHRYREYDERHAKSPLSLDQSTPGSWSRGGGPAPRLSQVARSVPPCPAQADRSRSCRSRSTPSRQAWRRLGRASRSTVRRKHSLGFVAEAEAAGGKPLDIGEYATATNTLRWLLLDLGLERRMHDITPTIDSYIGARQ